MRVHWQKYEYLTFWTFAASPLKYEAKNPTEWFFSSNQPHSWRSIAANAIKLNEQRIFNNLSLHIFCWFYKWTVHVSYRIRWVSFAPTLANNSVWDTAIKNINIPIAKKIKHNFRIELDASSLSAMPNVCDLKKYYFRLMWIDDVKHRNNLPHKLQRKRLQIAEARIPK